MYPTGRDINILINIIYINILVASSINNQTNGRKIFFGKVEAISYKT